MGIAASVDGGRHESLAALMADEPAFRAWYDATLPRVYRYLLARCGHDVALAEELTQQTFIEAVRRRAQFDGRADVVTWLCAIGRNKLIDHYRRAARDRGRDLRLVQGKSDPAAAWQRVERHDAVEVALDRLQPEQRLVLVLRYLDGLPVRDVARTLGRSESAAESLLVRAREAFRRAYGGQTDA